MVPAQSCALSGSDGGPLAMFLVGFALVTWAMAVPRRMPTRPRTNAEDAQDQKNRAEIKAVEAELRRPGQS